jgi:hypothetical protein
VSGRTTLVLVIVALLLAAAVYFGVARPQETATPTPFPTLAPGPEPLFTVSADQVTALRILEPDSGRAAAFRRSDGTWQITEAATQTVTLPAPVDELAFSGTLSQLVAVVPSGVYTQSADLASLGLAPPRTVISFTASSGITATLTYTLNIGDEPLEGSGYFAQKQGDPAVYLIGSGLIETLTGYLQRVPLQPTPTATFTPTVALTATVALTGTPAGATAAPGGTATPAGTPPAVATAP